jgi:hypothetical protein
MKSQKSSTKRYTPLPEKISIRGFLDPNNGEYNFIVFSNKRYVKAKGLYDALSIFGINYDKAKKIVAEMYPELDTTHKFRTLESDYTQLALDQRFTYDDQTVLRYP